jgi:NADPH:quinone reductase
MQHGDMQAVQFEGPASDSSKTRVGLAPVPRCGVDQVLIAVRYAGINFKDVMMRRGDAGYVESWPAIPGLEVSGVVADVGEEVSGVSVGDRVVALSNVGGLAEFVAVDSTLVVGVPDGMSLAEAALAPGVLATADLLLDVSARIRPGDVILVHSAAGAVGQAIAQLARLVDDVTLIGTVGAESRVAAAQAHGYDDVFVRNPGLARQVRSVTHGTGVNVILDPQGTTWLDADLDLVAAGGQIVLFGNAGGDRFEALPPAGRLYGANAAIRGFSLAALSRAAPDVVSRSIRRVLGGIVDGSIHAAYVIVDGLPAAPALQQRLADGTGVGKYLVAVTPRVDGE